METLLKKPIPPETTTKSVPTKPVTESEALAGLALGAEVEVDETLRREAAAREAQRREKERLERIAQMKKEWEKRRKELEELRLSNPAVYD